MKLVKFVAPEDRMGLDVKLPIGLLFTIFGILLVIHGFTSDPAIYTKSLGININLRWGALMLAFGLLMLILSRRGPSKGSQA